MTYLFLMMIYKPYTCIKAVHCCVPFDEPSGVKTQKLECFLQCKWGEIDNEYIHMPENSNPIQSECSLSPRSCISNESAQSVYSPYKVQHKINMSKTCTDLLVLQVKNLVQNDMTSRSRRSYNVISQFIFLMSCFKKKGAEIYTRNLHKTFELFTLLLFFLLINGIKKQLEKLAKKQCNPVMWLRFAQITLEVRGGVSGTRPFAIDRTLLKLQNTTLSGVSYQKTKDDILVRQL